MTMRRVSRCFRLFLEGMSFYYYRVRSLIYKFLNFLMTRSSITFYRSLFLWFVVIYSTLSLFSEVFVLMSLRSVTSVIYSIRNINHILFSNSFRDFFTSPLTFRVFILSLKIFETSFFINSSVTYLNSSLIYVDFSLKHLTL